MSSSMRRLACAVLALTAAGACRGNPRTGSASTGDSGATGAVTRPSPDTAAADTARMGGTGGALSDANIVALLDEANQADSAAGALAAGKATSPAVKQFAKLMMSEHHALRVQGQQLAKKVQITPSKPANDPLAPMAQQEMTTLQSTAKGPEFDRAYIQQEVAAHRAVRDLLGQAKSAAENDELKALIGKAQPVIEKHLNQAESIQKRLTPST